MSFNTQTFLFCDWCSELHDECGDSRRAIWDDATVRGWKKIDGEHVCHKCVQEEVNNA